MLIFPAVDLIGGEAVRLFKGDYAQKTVYSSNPVAVAVDFLNCGAKQIHLVDLDGARHGGAPNFDTICRIKAETGLFCEVGGGIRSIEAVQKYISAGIDRVILGTAALKDRDFLLKAIACFGDRIAVGVDMRDGKVAVNGWIDKTDIDGVDFCREMERTGVKTIIVTDISKDGAMNGTNRALYKRLADEVKINITASGGVSGMDDIISLRRLNLYGAIIGKAYYIGAINLRDAVEAAE